MQPCILTCKLKCYHATPLVYYGPNGPVEKIVRYSLRSLLWDITKTALLIKAEQTLREKEIILLQQYRSVMSISSEPLVATESHLVFPLVLVY